MAKLLSLALALLALGPLTVSAQYGASAPSAHMDMAYNAQLASQKLASSDAAFCSQYTGAAHSACAVTRNYLAQINSGSDKKGSYPPQADGTYVQSNDELNQLADRLPGG